MNNYNILLASTDNAPAVLCSAASIMWQWPAIIKGENQNGKHFNQPPDGPYASWYGHYKVQLEDPFAVSNQTSWMQSEEGSDTTRPIPKEVMNMIQLAQLAQLIAARLCCHRSRGRERVEAEVVPAPGFLDAIADRDSAIREFRVSSRPVVRCVLCAPGLRRRLQIGIRRFGSSSRCASVDRF
ncbi:hypothetical protein LXL04_000020 [Taraxacum kok-saghyz]